MAQQVTSRFGRGVRRLREAAGYSQEGFAGAVGLDRTYYSKIERGLANPTLTVLERVARGLGVSISDLLAVIDER